MIYIKSVVARLESELSRTRQLLAEALKRVEARLGDDLDRDVKVG